MSRSRSPTPADAPAVLELLAARDIADLGAPDYTLADLQQQWSSRDIALSNDALVVEASGKLVGYAIVHRPGSLAVVAPDHEGRGIGSELLRWVEQREREQGRAAHRQWAAGGNTRARELLSAAGYRRVRSYRRMVRRLDDSGESGPPAGVELRPLDAETDARALHELDTESFAAAADYVPESFEAFCEEHLQAHDTDPQLSRVARDRQTIVGFLLARRWPTEGVGFIDILAVHPGHQRRGIGTALLRAAFGAFSAAGLREAQLGVASDNPRALRLYERAGMTMRFRADVYERPIA